MKLLTGKAVLIQKKVMQLCFGHVHQNTVCLYVHI